MSNQTKPAPPKIVIAPEGCCKYLTAGKEYEVNVIEDYDKKIGYGFSLIDDDGDFLFAVERFSSHLNGGNWIIKEREVSHD